MIVKNQLLVVPVKISKNHDSKIKELLVLFRDQAFELPEESWLLPKTKRDVVESAINMYCYRMTKKLNGGE